MRLVRNLLIAKLTKCDYRTSIFFADRLKREKWVRWQLMLAAAAGFSSIGVISLNRLIALTRADTC